MQLDIPLQGSNGIVYLINSVLQPAWLTQTVVDVLAPNANYSTLMSTILTIPGLADDLAAVLAVTVFAPTNDAFATAIAGGVLEAARVYLIHHPRLPPLQLAHVPVSSHTHWCGASSTADS